MELAVGGAVDTALDPSRHDLDVAMMTCGVHDQVRHQQRHILHQSVHDASSDVHIAPVYRGPRSVTRAPIIVAGDVLEEAEADPGPKRNPPTIAMDSGKFIPRIIELACSTTPNAGKRAARR